MEAFAGHLNSLILPISLVRLIQFHLYECSASLPKRYPAVLQERDTVYRNAQKKNFAKNFRKRSRRKGKEAPDRKEMLVAMRSLVVALQNMSDRSIWRSKFEWVEVGNFWRRFWNSLDRWVLALEWQSPSCKAQESICDFMIHGDFWHFFSRFAIFGVVNRKCDLWLTQSRDPHGGTQQLGLWRRARF